MCLSPCVSDSGRVTLRNRRGALRRLMPASSRIRYTNGAALPSMIGISGVLMLDDGVVDALADQRREQVLHGFDGSAVATQDRGVADASHVGDVRRDLEAAQIHAAETDAGIGRRGPQRHADLVAGVETDASTRRGSTEGSLWCHSGLG